MVPTIAPLVLANIVGLTVINTTCGGIHFSPTTTNLDGVSALAHNEDEIIRVFLTVNDKSETGTPNRTGFRDISHIDPLPSS